MFADAFADFLDASVRDSQRQLATIVEALVRDRHAAVVGPPSEYDADIFHEPLLFAHLSATDGDYPIGQLLYGALPLSARPDTVEVFSDSGGSVHLPRLGSISTDTSDERLELASTSAGLECRRPRGGSRVDVGFEAATTVAHQQIAVLTRGHPLLDRLFVDECGVAVDREIEEITRAKCADLDAAFAILEIVHPRYHSTIMSATRQVQVFHADEMNSFASMSAHGAAFFNASATDDELFFIEDIAHQCGHVVFNAVTFEAERFLTVAPNTPLQAYTGRADETRSVYEAFHGVFTEAVMYQCLNQCLVRGVFESPRQMHELLGRLGFILRRFGADLHELGRGEFFTESGTWMLTHIMEEFLRGFEEHRDLLRGLDFSNQPYTFSYARFAELNRA